MLGKWKKEMLRTVIVFFSLVAVCAAGCREHASRKALRTRALENASTGGFYYVRRPDNFLEDKVHPTFKIALEEVGAFLAECADVKHNDK